VLENGKSSAFYKKGQSIFSEGQRPKGLYCLLEGSVKVSRVDEDGEEQTIRVASPGDFVGYVAFFGGKSYSTTAVALEDSKICCIKNSEFGELQRSSPEMPLKVIEFLCAEVESGEGKILSLGTRSVRERLAASLLQHVESDRVGDKTNNDFIVSLSSKELAKIVGTAPETASRMLSQFKNELLISIEEHKIKILDAQKLRRSGHAEISVI
jgi:CRP-like cAMP-binding protein